MKEQRSGARHGGAIWVGSEGRLAPSISASLPVAVPVPGHAESVLAAVGAAECADEGDVPGDPETIAAEQALGVAVALAMLGKEDRACAEGATCRRGSHPVDEQEDQAEEDSAEGGNDQMILVGEEGVEEKAAGKDEQCTRQQKQPCTRFHGCDDAGGTGSMHGGKLARDGAIATCPI